MYDKTILITGGAGFIGSNFVTKYVNDYPNYLIINLDKLTYAGSLDNISSISNKSNHIFIQGDICDKDLIKNLFKKHNITDIIHFAAESHVDNSISSPAQFIKTNIEGTFNLLENARENWATRSSNRFHHISTDEVYGSLESTDDLFKETTPYAPNSPYSASKASSDFIARAYCHTFGLDITISNCSNNYGPYQHHEKLIPTIIKSALSSKPIPIYGNGQNIRDWLYVEDHCTAIDLIFHKGESGETYNIGGNNERTNIEVVHTICNYLDKISPRKDGKSYCNQIEFVKDRPGHDKRYAIDASKIQNSLKWKAKENFDTGIIKTIDWYLRKLELV